MQKIASHIREQWVTAFREGREEGLTAVFHDLYPALCWYGERIVGDPAAAKDIAQEAFLKVWERRSIFTRFAGLKAYLYTIVRHDSSKWKTRQRQSEGSQRPGVFDEEGTSNALQDLVRAEVYRELQAGVRTLPTQCRQVMTLLFMEGKTPREVAEALQVTTDTVKVQKGRGLKLLRRRLPHLFILVWIGIGLWVFL